jgi:predicted nucleic acid-binding protein
MGTLIDSSVLVQAERGRFDLAARMESYPEEEFSIAAITLSELLHGLHRAATEEQRNRRSMFLEEVRRRHRVIPFDQDTAEVHARVWAELAASGTMIGLHDLIIAATAIANGMQVATRDLRSFPKIPGLALVQW